MVIGVCSSSVCSQQLVAPFAFCMVVLEPRHPNAVVGLGVVLMRTWRAPDTETWAGESIRCELKGGSHILQYEL